MRKVTKNGKRKRKMTENEEENWGKRRNTRTNATETMKIRSRTGKNER